MPLYRSFQYQIRTYVPPTTGANSWKETVTESRWHQPWSERLRPRVDPRVAIALAVSGLVYVNAGPFAEQVVPSEWFANLSEPVRLKPGLKAPHQQAYFAEPFGLTQPEQVTEAKWHQPYSEPVRFKQGLAPQLQKTFTTDLGLTISVFGKVPWFNNLSEPVRVKPRLQAGLNPSLTLHPNPSVSFSYYNWLNEPVRLKRGISSTLQQTLAYSESAQFPEAVTEDRWHQPYSEPVRFKQGLRASLQQSFATDYGLTIAIKDKIPWYNWIGEPVRLKVGLPTQLQLTLAYQGPPIVPPPRVINMGYIIV